MYRRCPILLVDALNVKLKLTPKALAWRRWSALYWRRMESRITRRESWLVYLLGTLVAFVILRFGFSPSSVSIHLRPEYDLNIYHLIGREWMQGSVPYLTHADLKGPLVFLLHGLGAVLSPGSFLGACLLESPLVGIGVLYAYWSARLFLPRGQAVGVLGVYSLSILYFSLHPAELVWVLQQVAVYYLLRWLVSGKSPGVCQNIILGVSSGLVLLVKFNLVAFWLPFCVWGILVSRRRWWQAGLLQLGACLSVLAPVLLYFHGQGALASLWNEYVLAAMEYGGAPWASSALCTRGILLASELLPLHLHQFLPEFLAALMGWVELVLSFLFPMRFRGRQRWCCYAVLLGAFVLLLIANYGGARCYIHYSFNFACFGLLALLALPSGRWLNWLGACTLSGVLIFALGLPLAVRYMKPENGNTQMRSASRKLAQLVSQDAVSDAIVLDVNNALHILRLSEKRLMLRHFVPTMVPGGYEQHREELACAIRTHRPRFVIGSAATRGEDERLLQGLYSAYTHQDLQLPEFPPHARRPEFILYIREQ